MLVSKAGYAGTEIIPGSLLARKPNIRFWESSTRVVVGSRLESIPSVNPGLCYCLIHHLPFSIVRKK